MTPRAVVTGLGVVSGLGLGVSALWDGLCAAAQTPCRRSALEPLGLGELPIALAPLPAAVDADAGDGHLLLDGGRRAVQLAERAAAEALDDAQWPAARGASPSASFGVCVGTTLGEKAPWIGAMRQLVLRPSEAATGSQAAEMAAEFGCAAPARVLARRHGAGRVRVVSTACASGNAAFGVALDWIRGGLCDAVLCGGVDALHEFVLSGFLSLRAHSSSPCRPFDEARTGLNLGEGAGFLLLESESHALRRGARIRANLDGYGLACDARHMTGPDREGRGAARAMLAALTDAGLTAAEVDFVSAHGTATLFNDLMEARALESVLATRSASVPVNSIKGSIGHTLGAAGAIEAVMAVRVLESQCIPPTAGHQNADPQIGLDIVAGAPRQAQVATILSTSSGFGGINSAVVLTSRRAA